MCCLRKSVLQPEDLGESAFFFPLSVVIGIPKIEFSFVIGEVTLEEETSGLEELWVLRCLTSVLGK